MDLLSGKEVPNLVGSRFALSLCDILFIVAKSPVGPGLFFSHWSVFLSHFI